MSCCRPCPAAVHVLAPRLTRRHLTGACECCSSSHALFSSLIIYKRRLRTPGLQIDHVREGDLYEDACLILHQFQGAKEYGIHLLPQFVPPTSALYSCLHWGTKVGRTWICRAWPVNTHWLSEIVPVLCNKSDIRIPQTPCCCLVSCSGRSPVSHPTCDVPFPSMRSGEYWKVMIPARPLYQGVRGSVWESGSVIGADRRRCGPSCVLPKGVPQGQTEYGGIGSPPYAGPPGRAPRGRVTRKRRCTYRPSVRY
jgi:hypothetical protein